MNKYTFIATVLLALPATSHANYTPPIGIPSPDWGDTINPITSERPTRPNNWDSTIENYYYIDPSSSLSTDNSNTNGYPGKPRKSIPKKVAAGSYVELKGNFTNNNIDIDYDCSASKPCWLVGNSANRPSFTGRIDIYGSSYLIVDNLNFSGGEGGAFRVGGGSNNVALRNSNIANKQQSRNNSGNWINYSGVVVAAEENQTTENIIIYNNTFSKLGQYTYNGSEDPDFHGVATTLYSSNNAVVKDVWVLENDCSDVAGDCVQVNAGSASRWPDIHHIYIGKNVMELGRQAGVGIKQSRDVVISQNKIYGTQSSIGSTGIGYQYEKNNVWIIFNEIYDSNYGIRQSNTSQVTNGNEVHIIGNLIYNIYPDINTSYNPRDSWSQGTAIALHRGNLDRFIIDNTIVGAYDGINIIDKGGVDIAGNIIADIGSQEGNRFFTTDYAGDSNLVSIDYNLFYDNARQEYRNGSNRSNATDNLTNLKQQKPSYCKVFCDFINPGFVNASLSNHDFRLTENSPAIGKNTKHYSYERFQQLYGIDIFVDFNGNKRSQKSSLGAFEYSTSTTPTPSLTPLSPEPEASNTSIEIRWPTKNNSYTTSSSSFDFGGNTPNNKTLKEVTWKCISGCTGSGQGIINPDASTNQNNWHIKNFQPVNGSNTVVVTAKAADGSSASDQIIFNKP